MAFQRSLVGLTTGYGNQTRVFLQRLVDLGYDLSCTAFWGVDGARLQFGDVSIYPKRHDTYGMDVASANCMHAGAKVIISLMDAWVCDPPALQKHNIKWVPWFPIDSEPLPGPVANTVKLAYKRIVFSPFGVRMMEQADMDCYYVPHGVDTDTFAPSDENRDDVRERINLPTDKFIVGMVAANKGNPSRKAFFEQLSAFAGLKKKHDDVFLYLHTYDGVGGYGFPVDLPGLLCSLRSVGVPAPSREDHPGAYRFSPCSSWGEGCSHGREPRSRPSYRDRLVSAP